MDEKFECPKCRTVFKDGQRKCNNCSYKIRNYKPIAILGYIFSFLFPIIGIFIGFYLHSRENKNGRWIMTISLIMLMIILIVPWASDINLNYYYYYQ